MFDFSKAGTFSFIWVVSWMIQPFKEAVWTQVRRPKPANNYLNSNVKHSFKGVIISPPHHFVKILIWLVHLLLK